jgi:hypothetical protein
MIAVYLVIITSLGSAPRHMLDLAEASQMAEQGFDPEYGRTLLRRL